MTRKPLLLGLDNPHSTNPRAALLPRPSGSAGERLFRLSGMGWSDYRRAFDRANVCDISPSDLEGRTTLVLGKEAWRKLGLPTVESFSRVFGISYGTLFIQIPHPSGRNHWYNSAKNRNRVSRLLRRLAR